MRSADGSAGSSPSATCRRRRASSLRPSHHSALASATVSASRCSREAEPQRVEQRVARGRRVAGGRLRVGEPRLHPGSALALLGPLGEQAQRGGLEAGRGGRRGGLQLARRRRRAARSPARRRRRAACSTWWARATTPAPSALERPRRAGVRAQPPAAGRRHVDRVADERVAEGEAPRRAGRPHERARQQLVERAQRGCLGELGDLGGETRARTDRRRPRPRRAAGAPRARGPPARPPGRRRPRPGRSVRGRRAAAGAGAHARELLEVERVAAGLLVDRRARSRRPARPPRPR